MRERPEPYDEDRHRWLVPGWAARLSPPSSANGWACAVLGGVAVAVLAIVSARLAVEHWYVSLPVLAVLWWAADRWCRARWAAEQARRARLADRSWTIGELDAMSWLDFEFAVRDLMRRDGVAAEHVGKPGDFSGDVVGFDPVLGETWMVQAKHYGPKTKVGSQDVQRVAGAARPVYQAGLTLVVTTNVYTKPARDFAAMAGMHLIDRASLTDWAARGLHLYDVLGIAPQNHRRAA
ncbi:restriction endonuclease [Actinomadura rifamycini]|uniref:restriction endonuclease n=1 Tax=Actinomadura rifamycini TaxID=31962 RepID=UPI000424269E|nr:restriction endonuclease [Actinomadura rifamycini]